jgi:hypothetical protein
LDSALAHTRRIVRGAIALAGVAEWWNGMRRKVSKGGEKWEVMYVPAEQRDAAGEIIEHLG